MVASLASGVLGAGMLKALLNVMVVGADMIVVVVGGA